jgi:hypothetical protein
MTAQLYRHRGREPGPAGSPRRTSGLPPGDIIAAKTGGRADRDSHGGWLACSDREAARLTGLSRVLLHDRMRRGNPACVTVGRWRLITCRHLQQFPGIAS